MAAKRNEAAGIYVRLSKDREGATVALDRQERECREWAARQGLDVVEVYREAEGTSGYARSARRPEFDRAAADLGSGRIGTLIVWKLDRLSRRGIGQVGALLDDIEVSGGRIVSVVDGVDSSNSSGRMVLAILSEQARAESSNTQARVKAAKREARASGAWQGGPVPFGFEAVEGRLVVVPERAAEVKRIAEAILGGASVRSEVRRLNDAGIGNGQGRRWSPQGLLRLLRSAYLAGWSYDGEGGVLRGDDGLPVATHEAILDPATWRGVQALLDRRKGTGGSKEPTLLAGLMRCGLCGSKLAGNRSSDRASCRECGGVAAKLSEVEAWAWRRTAVRLSALDVEELELVAKRYAVEVGETTNEAERAEIEAGLAEVDEAVVRIDDAFADGTLDRERYRRQADRLAERRRGLTERLNELGGQVVDLSLFLDPLAAAEDGEPGEVLAALESGPAILRATVERITVAPAEQRYSRVFDPARLTFEWR